jgi:hypothetical protein
MSPQTETKASVGFKAGVKEYKLTYYTPEYETKLHSSSSKTAPFSSGLFFDFSRKIFCSYASY